MEQPDDFHHRKGRPHSRADRRRIVLRHNTMRNNR
jgi:hypothetical protein